MIEIYGFNFWFLTLNFGLLGLILFISFLVALIKEIRDRNYFRENN